MIFFGPVAHNLVIHITKGTHGATTYNNNLTEGKTMKKTMLILAVISLIALIATQAFACYMDGYWGGPMGGPIAGFDRGNHQEFYDKTAQLRQDLAARQGEYNALLATSNPDPKRTAALSREISALHDQLRTQARSYNLPARNYAGHNGRMDGYGRGCW